MTRESLESEIWNTLDRYLMSDSAITEAKVALLSQVDRYVEERERLARIDTANYFRKYMISTSPFIEEILDPYIANLKSALRQQVKGGKV